MVLAMEYAPFLGRMGDCPLRRLESGPMSKELYSIYRSSVPSRLQFSILID
jgi:hypothetical protein